MLIKYKHWLILAITDMVLHSIMNLNSRKGLFGMKIQPNFAICLFRTIVMFD